MDNRLHGKIYIFNDEEKQKALVSSANFTKNGFYENHEWGVVVDDAASVQLLREEVLACVEYPDITEYLVDRLVMFSEQYQIGNPDWLTNVKPSTDIMKDVYNQSERSDREARYYLKPIGVSDNPIWKESKRDFSGLHQDLDFSKKGVKPIEAGDIVITTAVGCGCLLSHFKITGSAQVATEEEKEKT